MHAEYIRAEFGGDRCDVMRIPVTFRYAFTEPQFDFSTTADVRPSMSGATTRLFVHAYYHRPSVGAATQSGYGLRAVEVPEWSAGCLTRLARVQHPSALPLLLGLQLPPRWADAPLHETIAALETRPTVTDTPTLYTFPAELPIRRSLVMARVEALEAGQVVMRAPAVSMTDGQLRVSSSGKDGRGPYAYLVEMRPVFAKKGRIVVVQGHVADGGISLGLVKGSTWAAQASVASRGDFVIAVQAPEDGDYAVVVANNLPGRPQANHVVITRAGWLPGSIE